MLINRIFNINSRFLSENISKKLNLNMKLSSYKVNIVVLSDKKGNCELFKAVNEVVDPGRFLVYPVLSHILGSTSSWMTGCRAVILPATHPSVSQNKIFNVDVFREKGGEVVYLDSLNRDEIRKTLHKFTEQNNLKIDPSSDDSSPQNIGVGYYLSQPTTCRHSEQDINSDGTSLIQKLTVRMKNNLVTQGQVGLIFGTDPPDDTENLPTKENFILREMRDPTLKFSVINYLQHLETKSLGRNVIYLPSVSSSMNVLAGQPLIHGLAVIPDRQVAGEGRGGNRWISPEGCAMFSLQLHLTLGRGVGRTPSIIQHLVGLAVVQALGNELEVRLKWPNDIYFKNEVKLGGVIVTSSVTSSRLVINIGCGLNLDNSLPTLCVNQMRRQAGLRSMSREEYLASVFNNLELLLDKFDQGKEGEVFQAYHEVWLHSGQTVEVALPELKSADHGDDVTKTADYSNDVTKSADPVDDVTKSADPGDDVTKSADHEDDVTKSADVNPPYGKVRAKIICIDEYGYLVVKDERTGQEFTVHDDGNSFDMISGLIRPKFS